MRLTVPEVLPSTSTCRGSTTVASAISGLVTAMRVTGKSVCTTVEPPATTSRVGNGGEAGTTADAAAPVDAIDATAVAVDCANAPRPPRCSAAPNASANL